MTLILSGTDGLSDVDGTAATPAIRGTDANTGIFFPAADTIGFAEGGAEVMRIDSSGNVGIGVAPSAWATYKALQVDNGAVANYSPSQDASYLSNAYYNGGWKYIASAYAVRYAQDGSGGNHRWYSAPTGTAGNAITFTQVLGVNKGTTLALEGATSASGTGIAFPATQSASSDANTLDDYEEGTFTPTLGGSTTNPTGVTYIVQSASYRKIGSLVHVTGQIAFSTYTGGSGYLVVNGLPFSASVASNWGTAMTEYIDYPAGKTCVATLIDNGTVRISLIFGGDNVAYDTGAIGTVAASSGTAKFVTYGISYFV